MIVSFSTSKTELWSNVEYSSTSLSKHFKMLNWLPVVYTVHFYIWVDSIFQNNSIWLFECHVGYTVTPIVHWAGNIKSNRKHDTGEMGLYKLYCSLYIYLPQCFINSNQIKLEHMIRWHIHCINSLKTDDLWGGLLKYLLSLGLVH